MDLNKWGEVALIGATCRRLGIQLYEMVSKHTFVDVGRRILEVDVQPGSFEAELLNLGQALVHASALTRNLIARWLQDPNDQEEDKANDRGSVEGGESGGGSVPGS